MEQISKAYEPKEVEAHWYKEWVAAGCFNGRVDDGREPFSIVIPPPNVTGVLHMGHLLNNTLQDLLVRRARQEGKAAVWIPGTDHAGIATQSRVERELRAEGTSRHDLGRERFTERAVEWRDKHGGLILEQLKRLGASCDWQRTVHTLDPEYSKAVLTSFVHLYNKGHIYRGRRMVNWCPVSLTALSDEEVIMKPQNGILYRMRYEVADQPGRFVEISTTRPETLMGDSGVAVHPEDERYRDLVGKHVWRPFPRAKIPVVADVHVDREFGTGVLKITPAHDKADYEIGLRHNLEVIDILNPDGTLNERAGEPFVGMERFKARKQAAAMLAEMGLLVAEEPYANSVGFSERADVPIEPRLSEQWFLRYPRVEEAKDVVRRGILKFYPQRWEKTYLHWLESIQDWCISRQLWWGHRIPVWYRKGADRSDPANWHVSVDGPTHVENWEQDEDVLDTWASSWLWPFATLGWPDPDPASARELNYWYPTSVLVTAPDIIFFWVARMIMAGLELNGPDKEKLDDDDLARRIPFRAVYLNGLIRDEKGRKMSKSLGNSPEPLDLIDRYGADGLRLGLLMIAPEGQDIRFSEQRVEQGRNFCNKLWNACRFRQMSGDTDDNSLQAIVARIDASVLDEDDHAVLFRLLETTERVSRSYADFDFNSLTDELYTFFWNDFCDWYVEVSKSKLAQEGSAATTCLAIQDLALRQLLQLLHPLIPFITEELWLLMGYAQKGDFIESAELVDAAALRDRLAAGGVVPNGQAAATVDELRELVTQARALKAQYKIASRKDVEFAVFGEGAAAIAEQSAKLCRLIGAASIEAVSEAPSGAAAVVIRAGTLYLRLEGAVDLDAERKKLQAEVAKVQAFISSTEKRLGNPSFTGKAPQAVVDGAKRQLDEAGERLSELNRLLETIS